MNSSPACPDHTEKGLLFELLNASDNAGMTLTESYAMQYFAVGKIGQDQLRDYASRKGWYLATTEKWLAPLVA